MSDIVEAIRRIEQTERNTLSKLAEKNQRQFEMQETIYLGKFNGKKLFRLSELDNKDNYTAVLYKYFDENGNLQGIKNVRPDGEKDWIYLEEEWEQLKDEIDMNEAQLEEEIEKIFAELEKQGILKEDVDNITEIKVKEDDEEEPDEEKEEDEELEENEEEEEVEKVKAEKSKEEKGENRESQQTRAYNNVLNEVDTDRAVDQRGTELGEALGLDEYGYTKLFIIHADNVRDIKDADGNRGNTPTKKIAILGVRKDEKGEEIVEQVPEKILGYDRRSNNQSIRFDDNDQVEKNTGTYERFVNPKTNRGISIEMSEMETKVYYQGGIDRDDNTAVMGRIEDSRTGWVDADTKRIFNSNHGIYQQDKINEEISRHDPDRGEEIHRDNADGDLETVSGHLHEIDENSEIYYKGQLRPVEEVASMPEFKISAKHFVELYNAKARELEGKNDIDLDKVYDGIEEDVNDELQNPPNR